jgi:hypothetical protein
MAVVRKKKAQMPLTKEAQEKNSHPRAEFNGAGKEREFGPAMAFYRRERVRG